MPAQTAFQLSLPIDSNRVGRPRLNRYFRLLSRFYEPYLLLFCLGQTQEGHTPYPVSVSEHQEQRREFMRNLAVICDYKKGGKSFTAFAISRDGQHNVYWLGSPQAQKCARMLGDSLKALLEYATAPSKLKDNLHSGFLRMCVEHAEERIKAYIIDLEKAILICVQDLSRRKAEDNDSMVAWLNTLLKRHTGNPVSHFNVCMDMYRESRSAMMKKLLEKHKLQVQRRSSEGLPPEKCGCFASARHSIGRLAARVGKPSALLLCAPLMVEVLENHKVKIVKKLFTPKRPDADSQTTVNGILRRMLPVDKQAELDELKLKLEAMQQDSRLLNNYMDNYRSCKPTIVHSEISVLEHFFRQGLQFLNDDRYVYSSKPACFCCKLYFTHHPARMVIPESHGKVYLNWGPPQIENFDPKDASSIRQRDLMNKIIQAVRGAALDQLWGRRHPRDGHPDSTAGVPSVVPSQVTLREWYNASNVGALPHGSARLSEFDSGYSSSAIRGLLETDLSFTGDVVSSSDMTGPEQQIPESSDDDDSDDEEGGALV